MEADKRVDAVRSRRLQNEQGQQRGPAPSQSTKSTSRKTAAGSKANAQGSGEEGQAGQARSRSTMKPTHGTGTEGIGGATTSAGPRAVGSSPARFSTIRNGSGPPKSMVSKIEQLGLSDPDGTNF